MSGILRLEKLNKGNTLRQGDLTLLKYRLFDADGEKLDISGKSATVRLMKNNFTFIAYEKEGLTVASDDTISFNINKILSGGIYYLEVIVDDKYIFPSRSDEGKFNVDKSSLGAELTIIENAGIDAVVRKAVELINADPNLIIDEDKLISEIIANTGIKNIEEYYQQYSDVIKELSKDKDYHSLPEIAEARAGFDTLGERLNDTTAQLTQKATKKELNALGELKLAGVYATVSELKGAHPSGSQNVFLVTEDGYLYRWDNTTWLKTVQFQSEGIARDSINLPKMTPEFREDYSRMQEALSLKYTVNDISHMDVPDFTHNMHGVFRMLTESVSQEGYIRTIKLIGNNPGEISIKILKKNPSGTFSILREFPLTFEVGVNIFEVSEKVYQDEYIGFVQLTGGISGAVGTGVNSYHTSLASIENEEFIVQSTGSIAGLEIGVVVDTITELPAIEYINSKLIVEGSSEPSSGSSTENYTRIHPFRYDNYSELEYLEVQLNGPGIFKVKSFTANGELRDTGTTFSLKDEVSFNIEEAGYYKLKCNLAIYPGGYIGVHSNTSIIPYSNTGESGMHFFSHNGDAQGDSRFSRANMFYLHIKATSYVVMPHTQLVSSVPTENPPTVAPVDARFDSHLMQVFPNYTTIGDSLTAGFTNLGENTTGSAIAVQTKNNWPGYLSLRTGRTFNNIAVGGSHSKHWRDTHIVTADIPTDCYLVRLGVNDVRGSRAVGSQSDIKANFNDNADSFYGNYDFVIRKIMEYNPKAKVFVFTLPANESTKVTNYNVAIKHVSSLYANVHCIDLYTLYYDEYTTGVISRNDNGHLSPLMYNYVSSMIEKAMCDYLLDNAEMFNAVPYE